MGLALPKAITTNQLPAWPQAVYEKAVNVSQHTLQNVNYSIGVFAIISTAKAAFDAYKGNFSYSLNGAPFLALFAIKTSIDYVQSVQTTCLTTKYPANSTVKKLNSTLEIKQSWLHSEWAPECQFSKFIQPKFPDRDELHPKNKLPNIELIQSTFHNVRGKWALWQAPREEGRWKKVETADLKLDWVLKNVEVLYPSKDEFPVNELDGIILWKDNFNKDGKRYKLYEGNHRISAWIAAQKPLSLPATIFIGKPKKINFIS
ncbi:MAG: hypothetical protein H0X29_00050 [Parachlamydiaceae bacterium]|nr:hypothetical protein [Parachlamydiaceae bacterium]